MIYKYHLNFHAQIRIYYICAYAVDLIIASVVKHSRQRNLTLLIATDLPALAAVLIHGVSPCVMSVKNDGHLSQLATANCGFWTPWNVSVVSESSTKYTSCTDETCPQVART